MPSPLNLWMNIPVAPDGATSWGEPLSKPGDYVVQTLINSSLFAERILPVMHANQAALAHADQSITHSDQVN